MDTETASFSLDTILCARCDFPIGDLACPRCSRTLRRRTVPPGASSPQPGTELDRALVWLEDRLALRATRLALDIEGVLGRSGRTVLSVELGGQLHPLLIDNESTPDDRAARVAWVRRASQRRKLAAPVVRERYRLGDRESSPDVDSFGMLLHARLARAQLMLPGFERRSVAVEDEGATVRCLVELANAPSGRVVTVELAAVPADHGHTLAQVCAWVDALSKGWSGE